jgi:hypothetical protein
MRELNAYSARLRRLLNASERESLIFLIKFAEMHRGRIILQRDVDKFDEHIGFLKNWARGMK